MAVELVFDQRVQETELVVFGQRKTLELPVLNVGNYVVRPMQEADFPQIAGYNDPSLTEQLSVESLQGFSEVGYSFEPGAKGIVAYVAVNRDSQEVVGRAYLKTWHANDFTKPKFRETQSGGLEVITAAELVDNATTLAELGGWLVKDEHRGQGLAQVLTYATIRFISDMQKQGFQPDAAFITNVGPLKPQDNPNRTDYAWRLHDAIAANLQKPFNDFAELTGLGEVLGKAEFNRVFNDLELDQPIFGRIIPMKYFFGMPRQATQAAYHISGKLIGKEALFLAVNKDGDRFGLISPVSFEASREMHPEHGGNYTVALLRSPSNQADLATNPTE